MRTIKEIDMSKVIIIDYDAEAYWNDVSVYEVISNYIKLFPALASHFTGLFEYDGYDHCVDVYASVNRFYVDNIEYHIVDFIFYFENRRIDPIAKIQQITGVDLDDYAWRVFYEDGTKELLDYKGGNPLNNLVLNK